MPNHHSDFSIGEVSPAPVVIRVKPTGRHRPIAVIDDFRAVNDLLPTPALDVAFLLVNGSVSWSGLLLSKFARLMKAADARVHWGGDWPKFKDRPHFEVLG